MNKKGFTLIEILVVIVLLAAVSVTIGVNLNGMQERQSKKEYDKYTETLEKAACTYAETKNFNGEYSVKIKTLLEEGLLNKKLKNPDTEKSISEYEAHCILIKLEENKRTCTYTKAECS